MTSIADSRKASRVEGSDDVAKIIVPTDSKSFTKVVNTYRGNELLVKHITLHIGAVVCLLVTIFALVNLVFSLEKTDRVPSYVITPKDDCFNAVNRTCKTYAVNKYYFWNITNPEEVLSGAEPPKLKEVGPYVLGDARSKKTNIDFMKGDTEVKFIDSSYNSFMPDQFCDGCTVDDKITTVNAAYLGVMKSYGSEANLLYTLLPSTLPPVYGGIGQLLAGAAAVPQLAAAFPALATVAGGADALANLNLQQWASCAPLNGSSVTGLPLPPQYLAGLPFVPEYAAWAANATGYPASAIALPLSAAQKVLDAVSSDPAGMAAVAMLLTPKEVLAQQLEVAPVQAQLVQGYLQHIALTYGAAGLRALLGPPLAPGSSGLLIKKTVHDLIRGYRDPLLAGVYPSPDPRGLTKPVTPSFDNDQIDDDLIPWHVEDKAAWPGLGSTPVHVNTGKDDPDVSTSVLARTDNASSTSVQWNTGWVEPLEGKLATAGQHRDIQNYGSVPVDIWADFGSSLDFKQKLTLVQDGGRKKTLSKHVEVRYYRVQDDDHLPCPISLRGCDLNRYYHGIFNTTQWASAPAIVTWAHGYMTDPRVYGYIDPKDPDCPFKPNKEDHGTSWAVFGMSGNTFGMDLRYQMNFEVKPTDVLYPNVWQPREPLTNTPRAEGAFIPVCWADISYFVPKSTIRMIDIMIGDEVTAILHFGIVVPLVCFVVGMYCAISLYIKYKVALERAAQHSTNTTDYLELQRSNSRSLGSFREVNILSALNRRSRAASMLLVGSNGSHDSGLKIDDGLDVGIDDAKPSKQVDVQGGVVTINVGPNA